jgi:hypothetical protein
MCPRGQISPREQFETVEFTRSLGLTEMSEVSATSGREVVEAQNGVRRRLID